MNPLVKLNKLGKGTYGIVYAAESKFPESFAPDEESESLFLTRNKTLAVKRNFTEPTTYGLGNIRELDMMARLKRHPCIVDLISVSFCDPFSKTNPMTPVKKNNKDFKDMKEDKVHFIMEHVPHTGDIFFRDEELCTASRIKLVMCQLLLGLEYMHALNVTHRDLKSANTLISFDDEGFPQLKICDFGLSQILCGGAPSTPGVVTSWLRAPEICCGSRSYGKNIDIWSAGCIMFEVIAKRHFMEGVNDRDEDVFNSALGKMPHPVPRSTIEKLFACGRRIHPSPSAVPLRRSNFYEQMEVTTDFVREFNATPGTLDQYIDLMSHLLEIDPDKRWSATQALSHPFFDWARSNYIEEMRSAFEPKPPPLAMVKIVSSIERRWVASLVVDIYNKRNNLVWYKHRTLFHALDLFDRYLEWAWTPNNEYVRLRPAEGEEMGRFLSKKDTELHFYICLYLMHKYFTSMEYPAEWVDFVPSKFCGKQNDKLVENLEILLIKDVCRYRIYRETLFEICDHFNHKVDEMHIRNLLDVYTRISEWDGGSVRALYRRICGIEDNPVATQNE